MPFLKTLSLICAILFALLGCDSEDDTTAYGNSDVWGVWVADSVEIAGIESQDIEIQIAEDRILQKAQRILDAETNTILSENTFGCVSYGELSIEDEEAGIFNFYFVENLSFPSQAADNIRFELIEDGSRAIVSTKIFNGDGSETFLEYEVERSSSEVPNIDETSCASQE